MILTYYASRLWFKIKGAFKPSIKVIKVGPVYHYDDEALASG